MKVYRIKIKDECQEKYNDILPRYNYNMVGFIKFKSEDNKIWIDPLMTDMFGHVMLGLTVIITLEDVDVTVEYECDDVEI